MSPWIVTFVVNYAIMIGFAVRRAPRFGVCGSGSALDMGCCDRIMHISLFRE